MKKNYSFNIIKLLIFIFTIYVQNAFSQAPVISYNSPQTFVANTAITPLAPTSHNVASPGYNVNPVIKGYGFNEPDGVAVDAAGNIYVTDASNKNLVELPAIGGTPIVKQTGFGSPAGIAIDEAGDIYIADNANNVVEEYPIGGGGPVNIGSGFKNPYGVAVDASGNVYVADGGNNAVKKVPFGSSTPVVIGSGFNNPEGVAVDAVGNVYVADFGNNAIKEILVGGGAIQTLGTGFEGPFDVAVDAIGNLFIADAGSSLIKEIPVGTNSVATIGSGYDTPASVAVDASGNVYVADKDNQQVEEVSPIGGFFISPSLPSGLTFNQATGVISGTALTNSPTTSYTIVAYGSGGSNTARVNITVNLPPLPIINYSGQQSYTVGTPISVLEPASTGVAVIHYKPEPVTVGSGFSNPGEVAVDATGNVFVDDYGNFQLIEVPFGVGSPVILYNYSTVSLGVDPLGNVYANSFYANTVQKYVGAVGTTVSGVVIGSGANITADAMGNIYSATTTGIYEYPGDNGYPYTILSGFSAGGVAADGAGNLYATDNVNNLVLKISAGTDIPTTIGTGFSSPAGIAVDAGQNVYVADSKFNCIKRISASGDAPVTIGTGFNNPNDVAIDGAGNVYVAYQNFSAIEKYKPVGGYFISPALPLGLNFDSKTGYISGTPQVSIPPTEYTITGYNAAGKTAANLVIAINKPSLPAVSYANPHVYTANQAITPLSPTKSGVAAAGYGPVPSLVGTTFTYTAPTFSATDAAGDLYVIDNDSLKKLPAGGSSQIIITTGLVNPVGLAVNAIGDAYVAANNTVYRISAGTNTKIIYGSGYGYLQSIAVDGVGNVYVMDQDIVYKTSLGRGLSQALPYGFDNGKGLAADAVGNVFVASLNDGTIKEILGDGTGVVTVLSGLNQPKDVAVDASGNLFIAEVGTHSVKELLAYTTTPIILSTCFVSPGSISVSGSGVLYVSDTFTTPGANGSNINHYQLKQITPVGGYYTNLLPPVLKIDANTGIISGTPLYSSAATNYTITAYNSGGASAATTNIAITGTQPDIAYTSPPTYTFNSLITPLLAQSSNVAPFAFSSTSVELASGFSPSPNAPSYIASDAAGNVYYTYFIPAHGLSIKKIPVSGNLTTFYNNYYAPLAVDATGNVYVGGVAQVILKLNPDGTWNGYVPTNAKPSLIAIDPIGNVYISGITSSNTAVIAKIPIVGPALIVSTVFDLGLHQITGIAADAGGNIYVADSVLRSVYKIAKDSTSVVSVGVGFNAPAGLAVDAAGNIYVADGTDVKVIMAKDLSIATIGTGFKDAVGVSVDGMGNVYVIDGTLGIVEVIPPIGGYFISPALPAGLKFDCSTGEISGTPTAMSPSTNYTVTGYNNNQISQANFSLSVTPSALLSNFTVSNGTLSPVFNSGVNTYTVMVRDTTTAITVIPTTTDSTATVTVDGVMVQSGTKSSSIPLSYGANTITTIVTASDGVTTDTYTITANRALIPLTVTANNQIGIQGASLPALTLGYTGFVNGDSPSSLTAQPTAITTAITSSSMGNYPIIVSGGSSSKYTFTYVQGTLTMVTQAFLQAPLTTTYGNAGFYTFGTSTSDVTYGSSNTNVATVSSTGLIHIVGAGTAVVTFGSSKGSLSKSLTVNRAPLTITANNQTGISGTPLPGLTLTYTGFVNGDTQNSLTAQPTVSTTATSSSGTGYYPITVSGGTDPNYTITDVAGRLTMVTQTFLKEPLTTTYGDADFYTFGTATTGVTYSSSNTAVATVSAAGLIHIVSAGAITITFGNSNGSLSKSLTVNPAALTITANSQTKVQGAANPVLTVGYSGFVNGDTQASLSSQPTITTTATTASAAGSYPITASGAADANYTISYVAGTLKVSAVAGHEIATIDAAMPHSTLADSTAAPLVNPAVSPNGDGVNDVLIINNIEKFPNNKLTLINLSGAVVFEAAGYDNASRVFDGHSSINHEMQRPGTYFYLLQYKDNGTLKNKTGYIVLKY